jgi:2-polyprenyl-6-methoxyphenol hydroxylase-like FAD-dependent oxidoreductase
MSESQTTCAIVGGGPAGMVAALILARAGVQVTLLEKHADFLRDFRGDTVHPSTLQLLNELGLYDKFVALPQVTKSEKVNFDRRRFATRLIGPDSAEKLCDRPSSPARSKAQSAVGPCRL